MDARCSRPNNGLRNASLERRWVLADGAAAAVFETPPFCQEPVAGDLSGHDLAGDVGEALVVEVGVAPQPR